MVLKDYVCPAAESQIAQNRMAHPPAQLSFVDRWRESDDVPARDMMRHADIATTAGYGGTPVEEMRPLVDAVAKKFS